MSKIKFLLIILYLPVYLLAQNQTLNYEDSIYKQIKRNIFRIKLTQPLQPDYETSTILSANYEQRLINAISFVGDVGIGTSIKKFGSPGNRYQFSFHLFASAEARYYFLLYRRIRKLRSILNFSGLYMGIQQEVFTNPIGLINQTTKEAFKGYAASYFNVGYQKQVGKLCYGIYLGVPLIIHDYSKMPNNRSLNPIHGGVNIAYVF